MQKLINNFEDAWKFIICPKRANYDRENLGNFQHHSNLEQGHLNGKTTKESKSPGTITWSRRRATSYWRLPFTFPQAPKMPKNSRQ